MIACSRARSRSAGIAAGPYDTAGLRRLLAYAQRVNWRRQGGNTLRRPARDVCADYFESFLPDRVPRSQIARMTGLSATIRFVIDEVIRHHRQHAAAK